MGEWLLSRWDGAIFLMTPGTSCLATITCPFGTKRTPAMNRRICLASYSNPPRPRRPRLGRRFARMEEG
jgi:hypothetical protein